MPDPAPARYAFAPGHNGCDYGTYTHSSFNPGLGVGISFMMNKYAGLTILSNSSDGKRTHVQPEYIFCLAYRALFRAMGRPSLADTAFDCGL